MKHIRISAGRIAAILVVLAAVFTAGCNRVSSETAALRFDEGVKYESQRDWPKAVDAYQSASQGSFTDPRDPYKNTTQALVDLARVATEAKRYDVAVQAYTVLSQQHPDAKVSTAPAGQPPAEVVVRDWIGTFTDQKQDGPFWKAEEAQDLANHSKFAYKLMDGLVTALGKNPNYSYVLALLIFTIVVKVAMTPLTVMQFHTTRKMTAIQPKMKAVQEAYKDKPEELNRRVMSLYKEEGVNPFGCGATMLIQFPILIGLYSVIRLYNFQFRHAHFLWVNPVTHALAPDIIGKSLAQPDMPLLLLYAVSMFLSQKLTLMPAQDEQQRQQQMMMAYGMPIMFLFMLRTFPSAFILYWLMFNVFTTWQQWNLMRKHPIDYSTPVTVEPPPPSPRSPEQGPNRGPNRIPPKRKKK